MMMLERDWWGCSNHNGKIEASFVRGISQSHTTQPPTCNNSTTNYWDSIFFLST